MKRLWKKGVAVLGLILISGSLIYGDAYQLKEETDENEETELMIDEQYLIEQYGLTKEELEEVDVEGFIEVWIEPALADGKILDSDIVRNYLRIEKAYNEHLEELANMKDDYAWMFDEESKGGYKDKYLEDITVIAIRSSSGSYRESVIYDLENRVYYFGELVNVIEDYSQATASGELRDEDVEAIRKLAEEAQIDDWPAKSGWIRPRDHDYSTFVMRIATSDGSVYGYRGERLFPSPFVPFYKGMKEQVGL
ncbi:MAG: hypothetical protein NC089_12675 [Bacteroides sp.]|nr:hypothetical protein [Bacteroides sp.]MCM1550934.1 hypothetical protein [Clostridium sp.]